MGTTRDRAVGWLVVASAVVAAPAAAQSIGSDLFEQAAHLERNAGHYAVPDVGTKYLDSANYQDEKDRFALTGNAQTFLACLQWIY